MTPTTNKAPAMKMSKRAEKALRGSIKKWERIVAGDGTDNGVDDCPLCSLCFGDFSTRCDGCPVSEAVKDNACHGTPHEEWADHHDEVHDEEVETKVHCPTCKTLAKKELTFLQGLLP